MRTTDSRRLYSALLPVGSGLLIVALIAAVWAITMRELSNKRLYLEYEVYQAVTSLTDLVREQALGQEDIKNVLAFGLYAPDGSSLSIYGSAPSSLPPLSLSTPTSRFVIGKTSVTMIRSIGGDLPGRKMIMDRGGRGRNQSPMIPFGPPSAVEPEQADSSFRVPAQAYLEFSTAGYRAEETLLRVGAVIITLALSGLYVMLLALNKRYMIARDREERDRELVELGQAARTIAHEIKNPLGVIRIQCGLLKRGADEAVRAGLSVIDDEAVRLANLADRIRSYLKSADGTTASISIADMAKAFITRYHDTVEVEDAGEDDVIIEIDKNRVVEALDNIVSNAIAASEGVEEKPLVRFTARQRRATITVMDRGPGVSAQDVDRIFEPFYTTKERGSGLGLALARKNVEASGGTLTYSDRPGGGAQFTLSFPAHPVQPANPQTSG